MIITVTPNTGLDRIIFVRDFAWGKTIRADDSAWGMGGKGTDVSMVLGELEEPNLATGFAAGNAGERMVRMLERHAATRCDFVLVDGETRVNYVLIDLDRELQSTITVAGLDVNEQHVADLERRFADRLPSTTCVVMGGSLPEGAPSDLYARFISQARQIKVPVILDTSGEALRLGVEAKPTILKPNRHELETVSGRLLNNDEDFVDAARQLVRKGIELVVVTLGDGGLWAVSADRTLFAPPLPVEAINTAGAGDGIVAGLALGIARGWDWTEGLRWGIAAAGAVCLTPGTAICHREDVERLLAQVQIKPHKS